jgi:hypothetical protein
LEETTVSVLEKSLLHHFMVLFNLPSGWPGWIIWAISLLLAVVSGGIWQLLTRAGSSWPST